MEDYIVLSSSFRDTTNFPHVSQFRNNLVSTLKNISEIQLISVILPKPSTLANSGLLFLVLNEALNVNKVIIPASLNSQKTVVKAFCPLPLTNSTSTNFISSDFDTTSFCVNLRPAKDISNYLEVKIVDITGAVFNFGESSGDLTQSNQVSIVLKIKYGE